MRAEYDKGEAISNARVGTTVSGFVKGTIPGKDAVVARSSYIPDEPNSGYDSKHNSGDEDNSAEPV